ncbi:dihydroorotate dehydrogenase [bacterium]|nr:dihydroorotate dehydrogenase [bacterium]
MVDLEKKLRSPFKIGNKVYPNPIWLASGTCGFGEDITDFIDLKKLGGIVVKGTTLKPREGNPTPRVVETPAGMLNSIGIQNPGVWGVIKEKIPFLKKYKVPIIVNISGICTADSCSAMSDFEELAKIIADNVEVDGIEINVSCPNVTGKNLANNMLWLEKVVAVVKKNSKAPVITKLSPNTADITGMAKAVENGGTDAISLINALLGMKIDIKTQQPVLGNKMGGLSGPAIRPVAIRMVYQVRQVTKLPIIGIGGIICKEDIFEFFCAGADAVQLGTMNFVDINQINSFF